MAHCASTENPPLPQRERIQRLVVAIGQLTAARNSNSRARFQESDAAQAKNNPSPLSRNPTIHEVLQLVHILSHVRSSTIGKIRNQHVPDLISIPLHSSPDDDGEWVINLNRSRQNSRTSLPFGLSQPYSVGLSL